MIKKTNEGLIQEELQVHKSDLPVRKTQPLKMTLSVWRALNYIDEAKRRRRLKRQFISLGAVLLLLLTLKWGSAVSMLAYTFACQHNELLNLPLKCHPETVPVAVKASHDFKVSQKTTSSLQHKPQNIVFFNSEQKLLGVNYYPQNTPWSEFWPQYNPQETQQDLAKIKSLGFNSVRIFVFYEQFKTHAKHLSSLNDFLNQADQHKLKVIVTLFDQFSDYAEPYENSLQHLQQIIPPLAAHPGLLAWDLKNELDVDIKYYPAVTLNQWLEEIYNETRRLAPQDKITVGLADPLKLDHRLLSQMDFISFHYYDREENFGPYIQKLKQTFPKQALVLGEFGYHTWSASPQDPHPLEHQFNYFTSLLGQSLLHDLAGSMVWSLYDFSPELRETFVLQQHSSEHHLGLLDLNHQAKPGLKAYQQAVYFLDADRHTAVTPDTQEVRMLWQQAAPGTVYLRLRSNQTTLHEWRIQGKKSLNQFLFRLNTSELQQALSLNTRFYLETEQLLDLKQQKHDHNQENPLVLRLD